MSDTSVMRVRARVQGKVQGVFFRASTREQADDLELTGWVRNRDDGSVELEAQGPRDRLERLLAWCRRGPPGARVDSLEYQWLEPVAGEERFRIRY